MTVVVLAVMWAGSALLWARDARIPLAFSTNRALYLRSVTRAKALSMSFSALVADTYWLRTIQHFGGDRLTRGAARPFELLQPLLDLTTSLDPSFVAAYRFGAIFLAEPPPGGPGRADEAIALLEKGLRANPGTWQYAHDIGFVYLWHRGDAQAAAEWFSRAGAMPGAPNWLGPLAATAMAGADRRVAAVWLEDMARTATEAWVRRIAQQRLLQLQAMEQIDFLERLVPEFQKKMQRNPTGWADFAAAGLLKDVPLVSTGASVAPADPAGTPYEYFPASGLVRLGEGSPLFPLPTLPGVDRR